MASGLYDSGRAAFLGADIDWATDTIKAILIDNTIYGVSLANDNALDDIPSGAKIATSTALTGKSVTAGVADAADITFSTVTGSNPVTAIVLFKDTGVASTSPLIAYIDTSLAPVSPNGSDITVVWDNADNRIFRL
jgi:hypothetical protein